MNDQDISQAAKQLQTLLGLKASTQPFAQNENFDSCARKTQKNCSKDFH